MVKRKISFYTGLFIVLFLLFLRPAIDYDLWWHLTAGKYLWTTGQVPVKDLFSFSLPDYPYVYHSWLTEWLLYAAYRISHLWGVSILYALFTTAGAFLLARIFLPYPETRRDFLIWGMYLTGMPLLSYIVHARTQSVTFLFLAVLCFLWDIYQKIPVRNVLIWPVSLLFLLWANLHGGFTVGLLFLTALWAGEFLHTITRSGTGNLTMRIRQNKYYLLRSLKWLVFPVLATLFTPFGFRSYSQAWFMAANPVIRTLNIDWYPLFTSQQHAFLLGILVTAGLIWILFRKHTDIRIKFVLGIFYILSLISKRYILPFSCIFFPVLAVEAGPFIESFLFSPSTGWLQKFPSFFASGVLACSILLRIPVNISNLAAAYASDHNYAVFNPSTPFPDGVVRYFTEHGFPGRMLNSFEWGGYLTWHFPGQRVFMNGNMDAYEQNGTSFLSVYWMLINRLPGWEQAFIRYGFTAVLAPRTPEWPLVNYLKTDFGWEIAYEDEVSILLVKRGN